MLFFLVHYRPPNPTMLFGTQTTWNANTVFKFAQKISRPKFGPSSCLEAKPLGTQTLPYPKYTIWESGTVGGGWSDREGASNRGRQVGT